ncbi:hypothetical protein HPB47_015701 [Ixodes persulcatus]|uniref:Uncharacterized protein n=1 Tax=Ixodes persulcatus TaxID=34615 RepID=A0AC60QU10_IXOPE|nr:hypothetical protein HPB47_015701 [Ixodes persulcatus]
MDIPHQESRKNCCVVGCNSTCTIAHGTKYYIVPSEPYEAEYCATWVRLVRPYSRSSYQLQLLQLLQELWQLWGCGFKLRSVGFNMSLKNTVLFRAGAPAKETFKDEEQSFVYKGNKIPEDIDWTGNTGRHQALASGAFIVILPAAEYLLLAEAAEAAPVAELRETSLPRLSKRTEAETRRLRGVSLYGATPSSALLFKNSALKIR